jgi:fido (protein-threonine AMPylation protein)
MSVTTHCPQWEYEQFPQYDQILKGRSQLILSWIRRTTPALRMLRAKDTRPIHRQFFDGLTPSGFEHYAGHYRGEAFRCLEDYEVKIVGDPAVGHPAANVPYSMERFSLDIDRFVAELDYLSTINEQVFSRSNKLLRTTELAVSLFVYFLEIHPYANGNGHLARFLLISALAKYGIIVSRWPLHPRPPDPPYSTLISRYRQGDKLPLVRFVLSCI